MRINSRNIFLSTGFAWLMFLFITSLLKPPFLNSDPAHGILDLMHYQNGGKFQHHLTPNALDVTNCIEERTTWWSPGQWYFIYLLMKTGLPLGNAISTLVFLAAISAWLGWMKLYRMLGFDTKVVLISGALILCSRYLYSAFQIFPGASILEIAAAPWLILGWLKLQNNAIWLQVVALLLMLPFAYFVKSSLLILALCLIASIVITHDLRRIPWLRLTILSVAFVAGKFFCDYLFTKGGATPFSFSGTPFAFSEGNNMILIQHLLFILQGPFLATLGLEDYFKYIVQQPGREIFPIGHPAVLGFYFLLFMLFLVLLVQLFKNRYKLASSYRGLLFAFLGLFILFFFYAYITGRPISGYDDSRHYRIAGLLLLPLLVRKLTGITKYTVFLPLIFLGYAIPSHFSKLKRERVLLTTLRIPRPIIPERDYQLFLSAASRADFVYVTSPEMKFELDPCKSGYQLDDFTSLHDIESRPDQIVQNMVVLFVLPDRFRENGKEAAILNNFKPKPGSPLPEYTEIKLEGVRLITATYH